jgi:hypothetical protein
MKSVIAIACLFLAGCAGTTFYTDKGIPIARFEGDYQALRFENSKQGIKFTSQKAIHSTIAPKTIKAASDGINPLLLK